MLIIIALRILEMGDDVLSHDPSTCLSVIDTRDLVFTHLVT